MDIEMVTRHIKTNTDLKSLILEYGYEVTRSDMLRCFEHDEKTPSMKIYDEHVFCFGCKYQTDIIGFVQHEEGLSFMEALRWLNEKYNLKLDTSMELDEKTKKNIFMKKIMNQIADICHETLMQDPELKEARNFMREKGLIGEDAKFWNIGYCKIWKMHEKVNCTIEDLIELGFYLPSEQKVYTNLFYNRLLFPISERSGNVIAFGGRTMNKEENNKYVNTSDTSVYQKNRTLYGLDKARKAIKKNNQVFVVEGYTDVINMHKLGNPNTVATCGTALTEQHMKILLKEVNEIVLMYDGDNAGRNSMLKTINENIDNIDKLFVKALTDNEDPGELTPELFQDIPILTASNWMILHIISQSETTKDEQSSFIDCINFLSKLKNFYILKNQGIELLSEIYSVSTTDIKKQIKENKTIPKKTDEKRKNITNTNTMLNFVYSYKTELDIEDEWFEYMGYKFEHVNKTDDIQKVIEFVIKTTIGQIDKNLLTIEEIKQMQKAQRKIDKESVPLILELWKKYNLITSL